MTSAAAPAVAPPRAEAPRSAPMPVAAHLDEATRRAVRAAIALAICALAGWFLYEPVMDLVRAPIVQIAAERNASLNFDSVTGAFDLRLRVALVAGLVLSSPVWLSELFAFVLPGLTRRERRYVLGSVGAAVPLFAAGCATGLLLFPHMVSVLAGFASSEDSTILDAGTYIDFALKIVVATGLAFVLPVVLVVLNLAGIVSARTLARSWRYAVVAIVLFSALATPSADVMSMFVVAVPMTALYAAALAIAALHDRAGARASVFEEAPCSA
ncbi:sec-independent protein translocase protein TatC [Microbacterium testaceum StLB037]|uniref:Sec-independent protein translocase protein TatC n=1 Tax=Microbacterium testaceum (strain StLB037) TaxID=979556 RepID=A0A1H0LPR0_MICTS|nr:twin-arginine translocase subunit TatC [Microbacterium testaceum]SDO70115.1 sec-independent protein translocase protein TatC [Microbacterium testaceum StLB037]